MPIAYAKKEYTQEDEKTGRCLNSDSPTVFPNASFTVAMIDRLIEDSSIIAIRGDSYRKRVAEQRINSSRKKP